MKTSAPSNRRGANMTFLEALALIPKPTTGVCPVCNGTKDDPRSTPLARVDCQNCGGQKMWQRATGRVVLRSDGTPCTHDYRHFLKIGACYNEYRCEHCGDINPIDSGD